ncbi:BspA family leucine-rich repeat surface protein [Prevotella brevis]|nr:BspA family leucine-rich repeat surface protein [Xylanibacter brevis]
MTSKRKTKQLRWLVTRLMLAMTMVMPASMWAQESVMYTVYNDGTLTFKYGEKKGSGTLYDVPTYYSTAPGWSAYSSSIKTVVFDESFINAQPKSCYKWFDNCSNLTSIIDIKYLNTAKVTNMSRMFRDCKKLSSLDLSKFDTSNVKDMSYMFNNCQNLTSLDLSNFKTANVTNMYQMFYNCSNLTSLDLLSFNTANVTTMEQMFSGCSKLTNLDLSSFNTANVTTMKQMFSGCSGLTSLNLSSFNTAKVTTMEHMFNGCKGLKDLNLSSFKTANVTTMKQMFYYCSGLTSLNLSNFDTANVTTMEQMFSGCSGLTSLNLSSFNTAKVTNMYQMFYNCSNLTSLDLPSFNTANVTTMEQMFYGCSSLTSLDLSNYDNSNVTTMKQMFSGCSGLTSLNLSNFKTANVTEMYRMFFDCSGLKDLDLSSFNTAKVTTMGQMFFGCSSLKTIYVSDDFTTDHTSSYWNMFYNCSKLVGAASYSEDKTAKDMANYKTGYFKTYFTLGENKVELCGEPLTTESLDLSGEKDFVAHAPFTANTATYSRDLSSSESTWFSLCLPFAYTPDNFTAYQLKGATADAVEIEELTGEIVAGTPVLFKFKDGVVDKTINLSATGAYIVKAPVDGTAVTGTDGSSLQLCGTYQNKNFSSEDNNAFILLNNKLMNPAKMLTTTGVTKVGVKPFRAYMTLTASAPAQLASARAFSIGRGDEGNEGTTAIDLLNSVATDDAEYYDINGRRIDAPVKGVNIVRRGNKTIKLIIK